MNTGNLLNRIVRQTNISPAQAIKALAATLQALLTASIPPAPDPDDNDPHDSDDPQPVILALAVSSPPGHDLPIPVTPPPFQRGQSIRVYVAKFADISPDAAQIVVALTVSTFALVGVLKT